MTIGDVRTSLGDTIRAAADEVKDYAVSKTAMQRALEAAQKLITGGLGGHVVINTDEDGHPNEVLIMDTDDINTAVKVLRMNMLGIGFSLSGYNGPFTSAWTIDGKFVADFITAGTLNAAIIKAGILSDEAGKNFWNMQTGEFQLASTATVGGQTVSAIAEGAVNAQTQQSIFNKLTNNGQTQGIYLSNGKIYINATYIATGTLADADENTVFNLSTGALTMKKGSINIGSDNFKVTTAGKLTCKNAEIEGDILSGSTASGSVWMRMQSGRLKGGVGSSQYGYIEYAASTEDIDTGTIYNGIQIQGPMLRISTSRIAVARSSSVTTTAKWCLTGPVTVISRIRDNGGGSITYWQRDLTFTNGFLTDITSEY